MRVESEDGRFAILVSAAPAYSAQFATLQLVLDGKLVGDAEPCIPAGALKRMSELPVLRDERLESDDPEYLRELLQDDALHDATLGPTSESLDDWRLRTFRTASRVGYLAWQQPQDRPLLVWLAEQEHQALAESALQFYLELRRR